MIGAADIANCMTETGEFDDLAGITPRAVSELFRLLNERTAQVDYVVSKRKQQKQKQKHLVFPFQHLCRCSSYSLHCVCARWRCRCSSCTAMGWTTC